MKTSNTSQKQSPLSFNQSTDTHEKYSILKMQNLKIVCIVSIMIASMTFTSCNKDEDSISPDLIGTWIFEENMDGIETSEWITFNSNNTGTLSIEITEDGIKETETMEFTYTSDGKMLDVNLDDETISISYSIANNQLTITDDGDTTTYTKVGQVGGSNMNVAIF